MIGGTGAAGGRVPRRGAASGGRVLAAAGAPAAALALALALAGGAAAQEPAAGDTAAPRDSAGMAVIADSAIQARMDSARRAERQKRNAAVRSLIPGDRIRVQLGRHVLLGDLLNLVDGELVMRTSQRLPPGLGREGRPDTAAAGEADRRPGGVPAADTGRGRRPPLPPDSAIFAPGADTLPARAVRVPVDAMERLWVRVGSSDRGAAWGALVGGAAAAVAGYLIDRSSCDRQEGDCIFAGFDAAAVTGIGGALAGAGLGALVGRAFPRWRLWFP